MKAIKETVVLNPENINSVIAALKESTKHAPVAPQRLIIPMPPRVKINGWWWKKYFNKYQRERYDKQSKIDEEHYNIMNEVIKRATVKRHESNK